MARTAPPGSRAGKIMLGALASWMAITAAHATNEFLIETWLTDQGMPQNSVIAITQTPDGYLWLTTRNAGLARYDGARFTSFSPLNTPALQSFELIQLNVAPDGALIITDLDGNLARCRGGRFTRLPQPATPDALWLRSYMPTPNQSLVGVSFIGASGRPLWPGTGGPWEVDRQGAIWFRSTNDTLARFTAGRVETMSPADGLRGRRVQCVAMDAAGHIWVGTDQAIAAWNGTRFVDMTPTNALAEVSVQGMAFSSDGALWVDNGSRLLKCRDRQWLAESVPWDQGFSDLPHPRWLYGDAKGGAWLLHFNGGVFHADRNGQSGPILFPDGEPVRQVNCWYQDREQNIWLGLENGGLLRLRSPIFSYVAGPLGRDYQAKSICEDRSGTTWVGTVSGHLLHWSDHKPAEIQTSYRSEITVYPARAGGIWLGAVQGELSLITGYQPRKVPSPENPSPAARALLEDRAGRLWIGGDNGLFCRTPESFTQVHGSQIGSPYILALAEGRDGEIWFGTATSELGLVKDGSVKLFSPTDYNPLCRFWALLAETNGTVWIGTLDGGLLRFRDGHFTRFTTRDGLPDNTICQILDDGYGWLWLGSRSGISRVEKILLEARARGENEPLRCRNYRREDGLPTLECSAGMQPACWADRAGRLWFTTTKGAVSVRPADVPFNRLPPLMAIEKVYVDGHEQKLPEAEPDAAPGSAFREARSPSPLKIGPGKNHLEIQYAGLSFTAVEKVRFRYWLEGLEPRWVEVGQRRTASFNYLPPGDFVFRVQACNNDGVWSESGGVLALTVTPYAWQRWWFRWAVGALLFGTIAIAVRLRERRRTRRKVEQLKQLHAVERERGRIARDIHDELGSSLTLITALSDTAREELAADSPTAGTLSQIHATASELTQAMGEIVWAVNPKHDRLDSLVSYAEAFAQEHLTGAGIHCLFQIPDQLPTVSLGVPARHNIFLAFKEAVHNVVKHSGASEARILLSLTPTSLTLVVADNGRGFDPGALTVTLDRQPARRDRGNGCVNMTARLAEVGGRCEIDSKIGGGTRIEFTIPFRS